jgi:hypothetical protein
MQLHNTELIFPTLLNDAPGGWVTHEWSIGQGFGEECSLPNYVLSWNLAGEAEETHGNPVIVVGASSEMRTANRPRNLFGYEERCNLYSSPSTVLLAC